MKLRPVTRIVAALAACLPSLCIADPVSIIAIGSQLAATGALGAALTISATTAAWIGVGAAAYGMARARQAQRRAAADAKSQRLAGLEDRSYRALTNLPPLETVYGQIKKAGYIVDSFASDLTTTGADGVARTYPDGLRHLVVVWAAHECQSIDEMSFGSTADDAISSGQFGADGWALPGSAFNREQTAQRTHYAPAGTSALAVPATQILSVSANDNSAVTWTLAPDAQTITVSTAATVTYVASSRLAMLRVSHHLGSDSQSVDAYLASVAPTRYTTAHRLAGLCYSVITVDLRFERWQAGRPNPIVWMRGKKIYDPRTFATAWSDNPALMVLDYLRHADAWAVDLVDIQIASVIAAANACDAPVISVVDGVTIGSARYSAGGSWETGQSRESVLDDLCRAMAGSATYSGQWVISAGVYTPPVHTLTDADLAGSISITQAGAPDEQISNSMRCAYIPYGEVMPVDSEPYTNAALVTADGGELWESLDLVLTQRNWTVRNIARITVETKRNGLVAAYPAKINAIRLQAGDRVRVTSAEYGWNEKVFRVTDAQIAPRQSVALTLQEDAPDAWDMVDASAGDPTPNTGLPSPWGIVAPITGLAATSGTSVLQIAGDGTIITRVRVTWDPVVSPYATGVTIAWTPPDGAATTIDVPADQNEVYLIGPIDGQAITIAGYVRTIAGASVATFAAHTVLGKSEPPPPVLSLSMQELPELGRVVSWTYPAPAPVDLGGFVARYSANYGAGTAPWDSQTNLFATARDARTFSSTSAPPDGEWDITIRAIDTTGNLSDPVTISVLLTQGGLGTPISTIIPTALGWPGEKINCAVEGSFLAQTSTPWDSLPATWDAWTAWAPVITSISYTHDIDLGAPANVRVRVDASSNATTTLEERHSSNGVDWSAWAAIPEGHISGHHLQIRATVSGAAIAYLYNMTINIYT